MGVIKSGLEDAYSCFNIGNSDSYGSEAVPFVSNPPQELQAKMLVKVDDFLSVRHLSSGSGGCYI